MLDLDPYGGTDQLSMFPIFLKRTGDVMLPPVISVVFRRLVRLAIVSLLAKVRPISPQFRKVHRDLLHANYRPISMTSVLSKVFESLVSVRL